MPPKRKAKETIEVPVEVPVEKIQAINNSDLFDNQNDCNLIIISDNQYTKALNIKLLTPDNVPVNNSPIQLESYESQQGAFCTINKNDTICIISLMEQGGLAVRAVTIMWPKIATIPSFVNFVIEKYIELGLDPMVPICVGKNLLTLKSTTMQFDKTPSAWSIKNPTPPNLVEIPPLEENNVFTIFSQMGTQLEIKKEYVMNILKNITENHTALLYAVLPTAAAATLGGKKKQRKTKRRKSKKSRKTKRRKSRR